MLLAFFYFIAVFILRHKDR